MSQEQSMIEIINRIKSRRNELMLSYQDLADKTGLSKSTLQRYETGSIKNMPLDKLGILAKALNVSPAYLMGWEESLKHNGKKNNSLNDKEELLLDNFNKLNDLGKDKVITYTKDLLDNSKYSLANDEISATLEKESKQYLMPIASHDDDLSTEEKNTMDQRINEFLNKHK
ncbi:helix-turn-helix domain-containing protein [Clostridium botulinum]|uniref:helix-turn-helix domain-containing protein n=1 Tax=Clostridium botulinum TaxID=1491 RepID=UPI001FADFA5B|nr:helix-turn-helix transcriptional regulator [Clostridium botulinum]